jgi:4a-hydroxytetrahydrobiopterin dehydratase
MPAKLSDHELQAALSSLPGWTLREGSLVKRFLFATYMDGIRFVEAIAVDAEARDHHPDLLVRYGDVTVFLRTHSAEAVTAKDVESARSAETIALRYAKG